jgi:hypothetical protein
VQPAPANRDDSHAASYTTGRDMTRWPFMQMDAEAHFARVAAPVNFCVLFERSMVTTVFQTA